MDNYFLSDTLSCVEKSKTRVTKSQNDTPSTGEDLSTSTASGYSAAAGEAKTSTPKGSDEPETPSCSTSSACKCFANTDKVK